MTFQFTHFSWEIWGRAISLVGVSSRLFYDYLTVRGWILCSKYRIFQNLIVLSGVACGCLNKAKWFYKRFISQN